MRRIKAHDKLIQDGFTLIELIIAMAVSTMVIGAIYVLLVAQQGHYVAQSQVTEMQQNLRAGTGMMETDFRMVGYDPDGTGGGIFALLDITRRDLNYAQDVNGNSSIQFTVDLDEDGILDNPSEVITYSLADYPDNNPASRDGVSDLTRSVQTPVVNNRELIAENIEALGIAYAFDTDGDGELDTSAGGNVIWAVDSDNNNNLDRGLDTDDDGDIDSADIAGGSVISGVSITHIRSARVWALARAGTVDPEFTNASTYVVADRHITVADSFRRRLLEFTIYFRNTGL